MKLTIDKPFNVQAHGRKLDATEAVAFVADVAARRTDGGQLERVAARAEALQGMLGRLIGVMIDNGQLRAEQVCTIFDYDVIAED